MQPMRWLQGTWIHGPLRRSESSDLLDCINSSLQGEELGFAEVVGGLAATRSFEIFTSEGDKIFLWRS